MPVMVVLVGMARRVPLVLMARTRLVLMTTVATVMTVVMAAGVARPVMAVMVATLGRPAIWCSSALRVGPVMAATAVPGVLGLAVTAVMVLMALH
jgi:hypothetical protein